MQSVEVEVPGYDESYPRLTDIETQLSVREWHHKTKSKRSETFE